MAENKWIIDGHHYTCPECGNIMAIIENESDEGFDFCPFCGKRMGWISWNNNKMSQVAALFGKRLGEEFTVEDKYKAEWHCKFTENGVMYLDKISFNWHMIGGMLQSLVTGKAVISNENR